MKQKKRNDKRRNINNLKNRETASTAYKPIKQTTNDYPSNYDNQSDNKDSNRNIHTNMGLGEKKKIKTEPIDQKDKVSYPKAITTLPTSSTSQSQPHPQPEVFDSYRYNAMSEMKEIADMKPNNTSKVFSHVEEKQQLDPSMISINDSIKKTGPEKSLNTNPDTYTFHAMENPTLEGRDRLSKPVRFYDNQNQESHSNPLNNDDNPFISMIKVWQDYTITWINLWNEVMKPGTSIIKDYL